MQRLNAYRLSYFGEMSVGIWESKLYRAHAYREDGVIRLDIERLDGKDGISWDALQSIKNECGFADMDAAEFYPAQKDVINNGNWRHLYVFDAPISLVRRLPASSGKLDNAVSV